MKDLKEMHDKVEFIEDTHQYWINGIQYKSVTTFLKPYYEEFNPEEISTKIAKGDEIKKAKLKYDWSVSAPWGTFIHRLLELHLTGYPVEVDYEQFKEGVRLIKELEEEGWIVYIPEMRVFHKLAKLCGTADLIMVHKDYPNKIKIVDHKTCDNIPRTAFGGKTCNPPINYLHDCKEVHYQLQLSVYGFFIEDAFGDIYTIDSLELLHLPNGKEGKRIKLDYMKEEAKKLVIDYLQPTLCK